MNRTVISAIPPANWYRLEVAPAAMPSAPPESSIWEPPSPAATSADIIRRRGSVGMVAGVVVAVVVAVLVLVAAFIVFLHRRKRRRQTEEGGGGSTKGKLDTDDLISLPPAYPLEGTRKLSPVQAPHAPADIFSIPSTTSTTSSSSSSFPNAMTVFVGVRTFTYPQLSKATSEFSQDKFVGGGGFGCVYQGLLADGTCVAVKKLDLLSGSFQGEREFVTEINVISRVHHKNLVSLVGYCVSGPERLLVYEYVDNNNLAFHLQGRVAPILDWPTRLSIALGAAKGIAYLHEECHPRIIHRDIKSTNILLDSNFKAKVADFGLAKFVPDDKTHVTTRIMGTFGYLAPEFGSSGRLTEKSDVFSFGIVLLELITGRPPMNLVEWASPFLDQALEDGDFETQFIDPKLEANYDREEMKGMVTCAAMSVQHFPDHRPRMSQVAQVLEGNISTEKLKAQTSRPRTSRRGPI